MSSVGGAGARVGREQTPAKLASRKCPADDWDDDGEEDLLKPLLAKITKLSQDADRCHLLPPDWHLHLSLKLPALLGVAAGSTNDDECGVRIAARMSGCNSTLKQLGIITSLPR